MATDEQEVIILGVPIPSQIRQALIQTGARRGWTFARSGRVNEAATAHHLIEIGLRAERATTALERDGRTERGAQGGQ